MDFYFKYSFTPLHIYIPKSPLASLPNKRYGVHGTRGYRCMGYEYLLALFSLLTHTPYLLKHPFPYINLPSILAICLRSLILRYTTYFHKGNSPLPSLTGGVSTKQLIEKQIYLYSIRISKYICGIEIIIPRFKTQATRQVTYIPSSNI